MRAKILNASAGSGKTYQLAYKYVRDAIEQPGIYRHILAVTFTNKATEEMKSRIIREIHRLTSNAESPYLDKLCRELELDEQTVRRRAKEVQSKILHDYSRFTVLTIDTFFQRIMRAFIKELGMDLNYNVEIETASVLAKSADILIEQISSDEGLRRWLTQFVQERIDQGGRWDIRDAILALGAELFKEKNKDAIAAAPPREELARIVAQEIAAAEATKKQMRAVAAEAVSIITGAGGDVNDFPYKKSGFAAWFYAVASDAAPEVYGARVAAACDEDKAWGKPSTLSYALREQLQPLLCQMRGLYDQNISAWNTCDLLRENYRSFALLADLHAKVQQMCDEQNIMLLSQTKHILAEFIGQNDAPFIYEKIGNRFDRFMIDEFQDTSLKEWENFLPLLRNAMAQSAETSVLIVGDIKQSIYRWRGGDWEILHAGAQRALGKDDTEVENLKENYRSLPAIVDFNNRIIGRIVRADNAALDSMLDQAAARGEIEPAAAAALRGTLADAYREHEQVARRPGDKAPGYVSVETFDGRPPVVERICALMDKGFRPADILILVRGATDGAKIAAELLDFKQRNEDPLYRFDVMTQEALVIGNAPVSGFVAATLRLALSPDDSLQRAVYNHFLGRGFDQALDEPTRELLQSIRLLSPEEAFERIVMHHDLQNDVRNTAYLQAIHEQIVGFCANKIADIQLFLRWWDEVGAARSLSISQSVRAIEIMTIHKAKGLEKRVVIIPYCSWQTDPKSDGSVPNIVWAERGTGAAAGAGDAGAGDAGAGQRVPVRFRKTMARSEFSAEYYRETVLSHVDNINLLYVALTRAAESLHIFIPRRGGKHVGTLLLEGLAGADEAGAEGGGELRYQFGLFEGPVEKKNETSSEHAVQEFYPTSAVEMQLRMPSQRYFEQGEEVQLAPRDFGILMHKAFENASTAEDIHKAVELMALQGEISAREAGDLRQMIRRAMENPAVSEWFSGKWQQVRNENQIVVPHDSVIQRPDRVMISGKQAVVVDYKFGSREPEKYRVQIRRYLALLREMGYDRCEGYLWYVKLGNIEKVEP